MGKWTALRPCPLTHRPVITMRPTGPIYTLDGTYTGVTPHVAQNTSGRSSAIDGRTSRHVGYTLSQRARKRVEEIFSWMKTVGGSDGLGTRAWTAPA